MTCAQVLRGRVSQVEEIWERLKSCCFVRRDRPGTGGMDVAALSHGAVPGRDRLGGSIPAESSVHGDIAVGSVVALRP